MKDNGEHLHLHLCLLGLEYTVELCEVKDRVMSSLKKTCLPIGVGLTGSKHDVTLDLELSGHECLLSIELSVGHLVPESEHVRRIE